MNKLEIIKTRRKDFESGKYTSEIYNDLQARLKVLIAEHGYDCVSEATGLTVGTLRQYARVSVAPAISKDTVEKAEQILKGL